MRIITLDRKVKYSEWQHITPLGDLHLDSADADDAALRRTLAERDELKGHTILGLGDWGDWVLPDDKRHAAGNLRPALAAADNTSKAILDYQASFFTGLKSKVALLLTGNHEATFNKRHHQNVTAELAKRLPGKPPTPGMCCFVRVRAKIGKSGGVCTWYILIHHGAWYGMADMPPGAVRWATEHMGGWQLFCFGHNHRAATVRRAQLYPPMQGAEAASRDVRLLACGSYLRGYQTKDGGVPGYGEQKGHAPTVIGAPLVRWRIVHHGGQRRAKHLPGREVQLEII